MYENESKYQECRNTTDFFASDEECEECSFGSDSSNESHGKLLKKFKTKFQSTHPDMHEFIVMPCGEINSEQLYSSCFELNLYNEEHTDVDSNLLNTCQSMNKCLAIKQCNPSSAYHCDQGRNIAHDLLNNFDIQPCVYKLSEIKLHDDRILQNQNENSILRPYEFKRTISDPHPMNSSKPTIQNRYDLPELNLSMTSVVTSKSRNFPPKVESLDPNCSTKSLEKAGMQPWKENTIDPIGIHQTDVASILKASNGYAFGNTVSETPRSSKPLRHAQTSPRKARFNDSDSSTDEHCQTKSSKRRKHRKRNKGILFRLSDEDLRKSNSDLFGRTDEEDCLLIKRKVLNARTANNNVHGDKIMKKIEFKNLNIDKKANKIPAENIKSNMESRRVSRKRSVSCDEISSSGKENNEKVCKRFKENKLLTQTQGF